MYAESTTPLDQDQLDRFCKVWADCGYDDPTDQYFVLFDEHGPKASADDRLAIEEIATACGLQTEQRGGELWVRKTQQIHDEIGAYWV